MEIAGDEGPRVALGTSTASTSTPIHSSNIGFQLLKKQGWKEGTGLGVSEQGRLEPIETFVKKNKRGLGAEKPDKTSKQSKTSDQENPKLPKKKVKGLTKKMKKIQDFEEQLQEKEFDRNFFRMFWPDNV